MKPGTRILGAAARHLWRTTGKGLPTLIQQLLKINRELFGFNYTGKSPSTYEALYRPTRATSEPENGQIIPPYLVASHEGVPDADPTANPNLSAASGLNPPDQCNAISIETMVA
jgi:hypothetical protein